MWGTQSTAIVAIASRVPLGLTKSIWNFYKTGISYWTIMRWYITNFSNCPQLSFLIKSKRWQASKINNINDQSKIVQCYMNINTDAVVSKTKYLATLLCLFFWKRPARTKAPSFDNILILPSCIDFRAIFQLFKKPYVYTKQHILISINTGWVSIRKRSYRSWHLLSISALNK